MEKLFSLLTDLVEVQGLQVQLGADLQDCLSDEERAAAGFALGDLNRIIARKDHLVNRFLSLEKRRQRVAEQVAFLIGFDIRGQVVSISVLLEALETYKIRVRDALPANVVEQVEAGLSSYLESTREQIPAFGQLARRFQRNKTIISRTLQNVNRSVQFFEQAFRVNDVFYTQSGKQGRLRFGGQLPTQINLRA